MRRMRQSRPLFWPVESEGVGGEFIQHPVEYQAPTEVGALVVIQRFQQAPFRESSDIFGYIQMGRTCTRPQAPSMGPSCCQGAF